MSLKHYGSNRPCECSNCDWKGTENQFTVVTTAENEGDLAPDLWERLSAGDPLPVGECPECDCLAYVITERNIAEEAAEDLLNALSETLESVKYLAPERHDDEAHQAVFAAMVERAEAALSKARQKPGETRPLKTFEFTLRGFDGRTDSTHHLIKWIAASSRAQAITLARAAFYDFTEVREIDAAPSFAADGNVLAYLQ